MTDSLEIELDKVELCAKRAIHLAALHTLKEFQEWIDTPDTPVPDSTGVPVSHEDPPPCESQEATVVHLGLNQT